jgi:hypothetical protein
MTIILPDLFLAKLASNTTLLSSVQNSFAAFESWLAHSGMPFFPGFTDHSPTHINDVLKSAASLLSDSSHALVSPEDVSVLCMAILLHDCGMHVTPDVFRVLVADEGDSLISGLGDLPWAQLWKDFLSEANRFGQEKLKAIFGCVTPLRLDSLDLNNLTERDLLLIGEFVRRHHTRLAHEIARRGIGRAGVKPLELVGFSDDMKDLAGLVARSHGMAIRDTFGYVKSRYGTVAVYRNIKVPFLMAVLRIADYIQVQSERAIATLLKVKELKSPVSRQEWKNHSAINDVHKFHVDPEALFVQASPEDVSTFLRLTYLFRDIQRELDDSWATLGEVYGRMGVLEKLGLSMRRIRSNLDLVDEFAKTVPYFPVSAKFDSSGSDLLKLLVGPLYDYKATVGIRELLQNSVDACRESRDLAAVRGTSPTEESDVADVVVKIVEEEEGRGYIAITDKGVGMTIETVTRYFLIAGASFRNSDVWKKQHADESGNSRITRGGRFGVGALASFLLGDEIRVETRHLDGANQDGIRFNAKIDEPFVQLMRCTAPVGTTITVVISDQNVFDQLRPSFNYAENFEGVVTLDHWREVDWFVESYPKVLFQWEGFQKSKLHAEKTLDRQFKVCAEFRPPTTDIVPHLGASLAGWRSLIDTAPYAALMWRYKPFKTLRDGEVGEYQVQPSDEVIVNGIRVEQLVRYSSHVSLSATENATGPNYILYRPTIAVYDPSGVCPINLQRSRVAFERMGIDEALARNILRTHFEFCKDSIGKLKSLTDFLHACKLLCGMPGLNFIGQVSPIALTRQGIFLTSPSFISELSISKLIFIDANLEDSNIPINSVVNDGEAIIVRNAQRQPGPHIRLGWFRGLFSPEVDLSYARNIGIPLVAASAQASLMPRERWDFVNEKGKVSRFLLNLLTHAKSGDHDIFVSAGEVAQIDPLRAIIERVRAVVGMDSEIAAWALRPHQPAKDSKSFLADEWRGVCNGPVLYPMRSEPTISKQAKSKTKK